MRADVNLSVRPVGQKEYGTRTEMKNMASLKAIARAIEGESARQIDLIEDGGKVLQETRRWDDTKGESYAMRSKEDAQDYKYFPEPDLLPIEIDDAYITAIRDSFPELPEAKKLRYIEEFGLPEYDAGILTGSKYLASYFERAAEISGSPRDASNWILTDLLKMQNDSQMLPEDLSFSKDSLGKILKMVAEGAINRNTGRRVFAEVFKNDVDPAAYVKENGLTQVSDTGAIEPVIDQVLAANEKAVGEYLAGNEKNFQFLIGQSMKALRGKADPQVVKDVLSARLDLLKGKS